MGTVKIKNQTNLTDFSALIRAGLYLSGKVEEAKENGFSFKVSDNGIGIIVTISEEKNRKGR